MSSTLRQAAFALAVAVVAAFVARAAIDAPLLFDDVAKISGNADIRSLHGLFGRLVYPYDAPYLTRNDPSRPLVFLLYALIYAGFGLQATAYHALALLSHAATAGLVYLLARTAYAAAPEARAGAPSAAVAALFFAVTPLNAATAAYVYAVTDTLPALFLLAAMLAHARARGVWRRLLPPAAMALALASKQSGAVVPLALMLYDLAIPCELSVRALAKRWRDYVPTLALLGFYLGWRFWYFGALGDLEGRAYVKPFGAYVLAQPYAILHYLGSSLAGFGLAMDHDLGWPPADPATFVTAAGVLLLALALAAHHLARRPATRRLAALATGLYLLLVLPTSSVLPTVDFMVDRRAYAANIGLALGIGLAWARVTAVLPGFGARRPLRIAAVALVAWLAALAVMAQGRVKLMQSEVAVWEDVLMRYPNSYRALINLGNSHLEASDFAGAAALYERVVATYPQDARALGNLALIYAQADSPLYDPPRAAQLFVKVIAIDPRDSDAYVNLGALAQRAGHLEDAGRYYAKAVEIDPTAFLAWNNLASVDMALGHVADARRHLAAAARLRPEDPMVQANQKKLSNLPAQ